MGKYVSVVLFGIVTFVVVVVCGAMRICKQGQIKSTMPNELRETVLDENK